MQYRCMFSGSGGQGSALLAKLVCLSAIKQGRKVVMTQTYGIEQRGGDSTAYVIVDDNPIGSPIVEGDADICVALSPSTYEQCAEGSAAGGQVFYNASLIENKTERAQVSQLPVNASDMAVEAGSLRCANIVMLGAIVAETGFLSSDVVMEVLEETIGARKPELVPMNIEAFKAGMTAMVKD